MQQELDFELEAANLERCRRNLASSALSGHVSVPKLHPRLCSHRVLTMDFIDGARVTDVQALKRMGVSHAKVCRGGWGNPLQPQFHLDETFCRHAGRQTAPCAALPPPPYGHNMVYCVHLSFFLSVCLSSAVHH
jgi:ABC1 atypical kinase-like domain